MAVRTYDPKIVIATWGPIIMSGFSEGNAIKAKRMEDTWSDVSGVDGEVTRSKSNDLRGEIEIILMQSSSVNDLLSTQMSLDEATNAAVYPFLVRDLSGTTLLASDKSWIIKPAEVEFNSKAGPRSWKFRAAKFLTFIGGNIVS